MKWFIFTQDSGSDPEVVIDDTTDAQQKVIEEINDLREEYGGSYGVTVVRGERFTFVPPMDKGQLVPSK